MKNIVQHVVDQLGKGSLKQGLNRKIKPELDFKAKSYYEIISWSETLVTEPPLTKGISGEKLEVYANTDSPNNFDNLIQLLCHTKAV